LPAGTLVQQVFLPQTDFSIFGWNTF